MLAPRSLDILILMPTRKGLAMNDVMTMAEIEAAFPSEWVLLIDVQTDQNQQTLGGRVICHSKDRDEVYRKATELPSPKRIAVFYAGPAPAFGKAIL
jgi:hypothetical protein